MGILNRRTPYTEPLKPFLNRRVLPTSPTPTSHWDLITKAGSDICFVCERRFKSRHKGVVVMIGRHRTTGEELWRHESCNALSPNWLRKFNKDNYKQE